MTEKFDYALALAKVLFGWNIARYANFNVTKVRGHKGGGGKGRVPASTLNLIADLNRFDMETLPARRPIMRAALCASR